MIAFSVVGVHLERLVSSGRSDCAMPTSASCAAGWPSIPGISVASFGHSKGKGSST
jgi:hypothetical protein